MASAERAIEYGAEKLGQLLADEINLLKEVYDNVLWMRDELRWMNGFIEDAEAKGKNGDKRTKIWIKDVTNIAQEAEDVVDTYMSQIENKNRQTKGRFRRFAWNPSKTVDLHYIGTEIIQIKSKIETISGRKERYGISNLGESSGSTSRYENLRAQRNINPHLSGNKLFVGFEGQKNIILERLIDPQVKKCMVVPIVGMGGLGKTTLATMIYNSDLVKDWFRYRAWVTVSEEFKPLELLVNLIKQVGEDSEKYNNMDTIDELKVQVHNCLKKHRYLIVLDDIWEQDPDVWQQLKNVFPDVENGSRVLITTRSIRVGNSVDRSNEPYLIPPLGFNESWQLFLCIVFPSKDDFEPKCPEELETLGKELVRKCSGLPLGVTVLGALLLATDSTINAWNKVAARWKYEGSDLSILALSYNHLPNVHMKSCFLYLGIYPEDHKIKASELTKFWIAEGFIPKDDNHTFEETANYYLDEFVLRCMVQVVDRTRTSKRVKHLRIHDLFRKWCISEAQEDGFFRICTSNSDTSSPEIIAARRLTIYSSTFDDKFHDSSYKARAILGFGYLSLGNFLLSKIGQNFKLLRVIYLKFPENVEIYESKLLKEISRLIHLRNITLISKALTYLPSSMGKLHNLQTLNIKNTSILQLPRIFYEIHDLRHLYTRGITIQSSVTLKTRNLQTLDSIGAGSWMIKDFTKLLNLRKLSIFGITQNEARGLQDSLHKLDHLKSLRLESDGQLDPSLFMSFKSHNPLSKLVLINWNNVSSKFPQNLISIRLSGCTFGKGVTASLEKLSGLINLYLEDCGINPEDELVFSANGFHQLENLHIGEMRSLLDWRIVIGALPKIKYMMIRASDWLEKLPDGLEHLNSLQKLEMDFPKANLRKRLLETLEDLHKIPQLTFATLNGIQLDEYKRSSGIMHPSEMSIMDDFPIYRRPLLTGRERKSHVRGRTKVTVFNRMIAPQGESKYQVTLEVRGLVPDDGRPGEDIVTILDVSLSNLGILKSAMKFLIGKLSSKDRISIVVLSSKPVQLCPLRQITSSSLDIETVVNNLTFDPSRNITAGIQLGIEVINARQFTSGRVAAIMLMSDFSPNKYYHSSTQVQLGNIPVHTFGIGKNSDPKVLKEISHASMGGMFAHIPNSDFLNIAFSQCLRVPVIDIPDLKLILRQINSTIQSVSAGNHPQSTDNVSGSVTIHLGDIYVDLGQPPKVIVDLCLPAVNKPYFSYDILEITLRYGGGVVRSPILVRTDRLDPLCSSDDEEEGSSGIMHPSKMSIMDDFPIYKRPLLTEREGESHGMSGTEVTVISKMKAPLDESKYKVTLEVIGLGDGFDRPGVDIVTILDVGLSNLRLLKSALKFLIGKLSSIDRFSIVVTSKNYPMQLCPLQPIISSSLDIETLVNALNFDPGRDITPGIQLGIEVINGRRFTSDRFAVIMLMSDFYPDEYHHSSTQIQLGKIPVFTFGIGKNSDPKVLKEISRRSWGGTFSHIPDSDYINTAFSMCLGGILGRAVSDLKLIVRQINSTIQSVSAGNHPQSTDNAAGSVTIHLGDIYVDERHEVIVDLCLPAVNEHDYSYAILEITSSSARQAVRSPILVYTNRNRISDESVGEKEGLGSL